MKQIICSKCKILTPITEIEYRNLRPFCKKCLSGMGRPHCLGDI